MHHQLELFSPHVLATRLPHRPYCTENLGSGLVIRNVEAALKKPYIQPNPPDLRFWLVYDVDRAGAAFSWEDAHLPPPNWSATNPANGHAHLSYGIKTPVYTGDPARQAPLRLAAALDEAYREALGADRGYAGLITKNPIHQLWRTCWHTPHLYELGELAEWVTLPRRMRRNVRSDYGLGRNVTLFNRLRYWAYGAVLEHRVNGVSVETWGRAVLERATVYNDFPTPLPCGEVEHTARSVAKWVWARYVGRLSDAEFSARQAARGRASGAKRRLGSIEAAKPWEELGISRRTWFRQRERLGDSPDTGTISSDKKTEIDAQTDGGTRTISDISAVFAGFEK